MQTAADRVSDKDASYQLAALSALIVGEETETFTAVTFQEDHASGRTSITEYTTDTINCTKL